MSAPHTLSDGTPSGSVSRYLPWCFCLFACGVAFSIAAAHIALGIWLLVWLVSLWVGQSHFKKTPLDKPVLLFVGATLITGFSGIDPVKSLVHMASLWHISIYLLVVNTVPDRKWLERGLTVLFISAGLNATYGLTQFFFTDMYFFQDWGSKINRLVGTFGHSMTFAGQMLLVGLFGMSLLAWRGAFGLTKIWLAPIAVVLCAVVLSYARNAWVGLVFGIFVFSMFKGKRIMVQTGFIMIVLVVLVSLLQPAIFGRIKTIFDPEHLSNRYRIDMARITYEMVKENPVLGVGGGNYGEASTDLRKKYNLPHKSHPHNNLFSQVIEKGFLGLMAFLYIWVLFFKESFRGWKLGGNETSKALSVGGIAALTGIHVAGMFEANFGDSEVAMMMWFIVGLALLPRLNPALMGEPRKE